MPKSKTDSLEDERRRLLKKGPPTGADLRRIDQIDRLLRADKSGNRQFGADYEAQSGRNPTRPWEPARKAGGTARVVDAGPSVESAANRTSTEQLRRDIGLGAFQEWMGEDDEGNITNEVDARFRDVTFGGRVTGRSGSVTGAGGVRNGMSVKAMMDFYYSLSETELINFQHTLVEAGLLEKPILGMRDPSTSKAVNTLMQTWATEPDTGVGDLLGKLKRANSARIDPEVQKILGGGKDRSGVGVVSDEIANITVTDGKTLDSMIDRVSQDLFGQFLDPERKAALVNQLQSEERESKTKTVQAGFDADVATKKAAGGEAGGSELDRFMEALIGQESGGNPNAVNVDSGAKGLGQFMYWDAWAAEAGTNPADFSADNQRRVMRYKLGQYYSNYGNWRDVAIAWYGGAGGVARARAGGGNGDEAGYPSLNAYADQLLAKMGQGTQQALEAGRAPKLTVLDSEALADPSVRAADALKRLDPAAYAGSQFSKQAENFFSLLKGVN